MILPCRLSGGLLVKFCGFHVSTATAASLLAATMPEPRLSTTTMEMPSRADTMNEPGADGCRGTNL
jgi:hypothetical protein